jgi:hypothetical protein
VLPGFLPLIGVRAAALGWIGGTSDAFPSFLKLGARWYSDRIGRRKRLVFAGYLFTGGTGFGLLGAVNGVGDLIASAFVGTVWSVGSPVAAFAAAATLMTLGAGLTLSVPAQRAT